MRKPILPIVFLMLIFFVVPVLVSAQDITSIEYGETVSGRITNPSEPVFYSFSGEQGDVVIVSATSNTVDVYLQIGDARANLLAENDDISRDNLNAEIEFTLPADGEYLVLVGAYEAGRYTLTLASDSVPVQGGSTTTTVSDDGFLIINDGQILDGEAISIDEPVIYTFTGNAGDAVTIVANSDEIDPYIVLADRNGNTLAENDDISNNNLNSQINAVLPANGQYLIGVFGYEAGPFELGLSIGGDGGGTPVIPVSENTSGGEDVVSGEIDDDNYYLEYPITVERDGDTITIDAQATSGDLDTYLGLFQGDVVVAENDDRAQGTTDSQLVYPNAEAGDYTVVVTRYGFDQGETTGEFDLIIKISAGTGGGLVSNTGINTNVNPVASGYPTMNPTSMVADWTVLVYMGGDNNLEDGLENDLDEFEIAGGSNEQVRIIALFDRAEGYSDANGDWTDTRVFEVGRDISNDAQFNYPPTIDTTDLFGLGEIDTSYGNNLAEFITWGVQNYPARHYAISINDHGGAWAGMVTDDATGEGILTISEIQQAFESARAATGVDKFDLLINDACLMSSVEYYAAIAPSFDYVVSSPEITLNPSFDMTLLTRALNQNPEISMPELGKLLVDKYLQDMEDLAPDMVPVLGAAVTDLSQVDGLKAALQNFAGVVLQNPAAYGTLLGQVRSNTYAYSFFLPEDQYGPATNIDLGNFMQGVIASSRDTALTEAAMGVVDALSNMLVYGSAGNELNKWTSYYNIYFPSRGRDVSPDYLQGTPLADWIGMLRGYFNSVAPRTARVAGVTTAAPAAAPSTVPLVSVTNVYPTQTSVAAPTLVSMEVIGRNISQGIFTVDQLQPDGTLVRLDSSRIVTTVVEDGVANQINLWKPGIDDFTFTWLVTLSAVTDGTTTSTELVTTNDDVTSMAGRYQYPGSDTWVEVTVIFDDEGNTSKVISRNPGTVALANIELTPGGTFQAYRSVVTPDGRVDVQDGTIYTWPEGGIRTYQVPAPDGQYNLGFLIEAFGGATGFDSATVTVNNEGVDHSLAGSVDLDWNYITQRPADWTDFVYFPDDDGNGYETANNSDGTQRIYIYPVYEATGDLEAIANEVLGRYTVEFDGQFSPITVDGRDALEFTFTYDASDGVVFTGRAFAVYDPLKELGLVFASEGVEDAETERVFEILRDNTIWVDGQAVKDQDTGLWSYDIYTSNDTYPVREDWMPGAQDGLFWYYHPDNDPSNATFAAVTVLQDESDDAVDTRDDILAQEIEGLSGYNLELTDTYYAENHTWEWAEFTYEGPNGEAMTGRLYATTIGGRPYLWWFAAPGEEFEQTFKDVFTVMLDGFKGDAAEE